MVPVQSLRVQQVLYCYLELLLSLNAIQCSTVPE